MKFRFVLLDPDDDRKGPLPFPGPSSPTRPVAKYERSKAGMLRVAHSEKGPARRIALTNFNARIVGDRVIDDGVGERREVELEANSEGQVLSFSVSASEFGRNRVTLRLRRVAPS